MVGLLVDGGELLPTPRSRDAKGATASRSGDNKHDLPSALAPAPALLPTPVSPLLPAPQVADVHGPKSQENLDRQRDRGYGPNLTDVVSHQLSGLLPTPAARDGLPAKTEETMRRQHERGYGPNLNDVAANYLPTPKARDWTGHGPATMERHSPDLSAISRILDEEPRMDEPTENTETTMPTPSASDGSGRGGAVTESRVENNHHVQLVDLGTSKTVWGKYEAAIRCWERVTRPAPSPTEMNKNGNPRLAAQFSEWLMGWPEGWVTDPEIGISRNDQLRITGNGVVSQQAAYAIRTLLGIALDGE